MTDPMDECIGGAECTWNPRQSSRWEEAVDAAPWHGEVKVLDCPRCGHPMTVDATTIVVVDAFREMSEAVEEQAIAEMLKDLAISVESEDGLIGARCNCRFEHDGHPAKPDDRIWGCGQTGAIRVPQ